MPRTGDDAVRPMSRVRWTICTLIFFALTVNYLDRQLFANLVPFFEDDLKLGPTDIALLNVGFILPYGYAMLFVGRFIDKVGIKRGLSTAFGLWTLASIAHAAVFGLWSFFALRLLLGLGESGMYPSAVKTTTAWFPKKERGMAVGFFNAGSNVGAILAPVLGVWIAKTYGWRDCFLITGVLGVVWFFFWSPYYKSPEEHPKVTPSELEYIRSDKDTGGEKLSFEQLFAMRQVYALAIAKAMTDAPLWFFMLWIPKILVDQFHKPPIFVAWASPIMYILADLGSLGGGWASSSMLKNGASVGKARKLPMLVCACLVLPVMVVGILPDHPVILGISSAYWAVGIVAVAFAGHQGWSCNLFTLISDTIPAPSMALAVGAINGFAMVGVSAFQFYVGSTVQNTSGYRLPFMVSGTMYLLALLIMHLIMPKVEATLPARRAKLPLVFAGGVAILVGLIYMQFEMNKPKYESLNDYFAQRSKELGQSSQIGPRCTVGWMSAEWVLWRGPSGQTKLDLIKFDTHDRPFLEAKGAKASKYKGPSNEELSKFFNIALPVKS